MLIGGVVVVVVALIAILVWAATRSEPLEATGSAHALPEGGGISVGPGHDADVTQVHIYEDFQCPHCADLEGAIGEELVELADAGELNVTFTIMSFMDTNLRNDSSTRAANGALCAADQDIFVPWHQAVFASQSPQGAGWTDDQFIGFARDAGLDGDALAEFTTCLQDQTYVDYVGDMQRRANQDGISGTPTVVVDGEQISGEDLFLLINVPGSLQDVLARNS